MSIFFEKKMNTKSIIFFLKNIFDLTEDEIEVFEQNYFFDKGYLEVDDRIRCLCTYRDLTGDVELIIELYRVDDQSPELIVKKVKKFLSKNTYDGFIVVENIDDDYLKMSNNLVQPVYINDEYIEEDKVFFIDKSV